MSHGPAAPVDPQPTASPFGKLLEFLKKLSRNRAVRLLVNLVVFGFCGAALLVYMRTIGEDMRQVQFHAGWMVLAWLLTWLIVFTGAAAWWLLLKGVHPSAGLADSVHAHIASSVARYVPGYAWQYIGKAYLTAQMGIPAKTTSILMVWEMAQQIWTGIVVSLVFFPARVLEDWGWAVSRPVLIGLGALMLFAGILAAGLGPRTRLRRLFGNQPVRPSYLLLSFLTILANWLILGLAFGLTVFAFGFGSLEAYPFFTFTHSSSIVVGILALPVPNGLGVREGIMAYLLGSIMPVSIAVLASGISRLEVMVGELVGLLFVVIARRIRTQRSKKRVVKGEYS